MYDDIQNQLRSFAGESVIHYALWSLMFFILVVEMVLFSPSLANIPNPDFDNWNMEPETIVEQIKSDIE